MPKRSKPPNEGSHDARLVLRLPQDLKREFDNVCAGNDVFASDIVRTFIKWYVQKGVKNVTERI